MENNNGIIKNSLKGIMLAISFLIIGILIFAVIAKITKLDSFLIKPINQVIKVIALLVACTFSIKENKGVAKGAIIGGASGLFLYALFALVLGNGFFQTLWVVDVIFMCVIGGICGIIAVNIKR